MSDLVERLREASADENQESWSLRLYCKNAADKIERLKELKSNREDSLSFALKEIVRLRAGIQAYLDGNYDHLGNECDEAYFQSLLDGKNEG